MTSSRRFDRLLQAGCLGLIGMLTAVGCGGSSSPKNKDSGSSTDVAPGEVGGPNTGVILTVSQPTVDLGTVDVGTTSTPVKVTVTNVGSAPSAALTVGVTGAGLSVTGCNGQSLAAKASCDISVTAKPAATGAISGTITVFDVAANTKTINVTGVATSPGLFTLTPSPLDLGTVIQGKSATGTVVLENKAPAGLTDLVISVGGNGFARGTDTCTASLGVGGTCTIVVNFTSSATTPSGQAKGSVTVSQGGSTKTVVVTATVQSLAKLLITPATATFKTAVGTSSSPVTFYVGNAGDSDSAIPTVTITGTNAADFTKTDDCATSLQGGGKNKCSVVVTYSPKAVAASATATLTVAEPGTGGASATASLSGEAVAPSTLVITGSVTDLGLVVVGDVSDAATFTLTNNGGENSGAIQLAMDKAQFVIAGDNCSEKSLDSKKSCTFTVQYRPDAADVGVVQGQIKATGKSVTNPAFFGVTATAVPAAKLVASPTILDFGSIPTMQESAPYTITVSNAGGAPTGVLKVANTGAQFSVKSDTCTGLVLSAAGGTNVCYVAIVYTASNTVTTDATGSVIISDTTGAGGSVTVTLHGNGVTHPSVVMAPQVVCPQYRADDELCNPQSSTGLKVLHQTDRTFDNMVIGQTSPEMIFTIYNETDPKDAADSGELKFEITGAAASDFAIVKNNCTAPLVSTSAYATAPTTCVLTLTFTPSAAGLRNALLKLTTSRGGIAQTTLEAKGLPVVELQPLPVGTTTTVQSAQVSAHTGPDGLNFGQVSLGHNGAIDDRSAIHPFRVWVRSTTQADSNTTVSVTLPTPNPADFVWPTTLASTADVVLFGAKTDDSIVLSPPIMTTIGGVSAEHVNWVQQANPCTNKTLSMALGTDKRPTSAAIAANRDLNYTYDARSGYFYCDFGVQFYPQSARGALTADLSASATGGGSSKLALTGTATGPLTISPSPATLRNPVAVGLSANSTEYLTLTISNSSATVKQTNLSFALSGTGKDDFQIAGTNCWGVYGGTVPATPGYSNLPAVTLAAGSSCVVWLGFEPKTEGPYSVTFTATAANGAGDADNESASVSIIATGSKTFGPLTITPNPATSVFADVPVGSTAATPVVLTVKNTGTLEASKLSYDVTGQFAIVPSIGVAGACSTDTSFVLAGGAQCTIQIKAVPTSAPNGEKKQALYGFLTVTSTAGDLGSQAQAQLSYYETSSIMVKEIGGTASPVLAYTFGLGIIGQPETHKFLVTNIGSAKVGLATSWPGNPTTNPFSLPTNVAGLDPAQCVMGANTLDAGASCTLVVSHDNAAEGVIWPEAPVTLAVSDPTVTTNLAKINLSGATTAASNIVPWGLVASTTPITGVSAAQISLGSVRYPASATSTPVGGTATVWIKNKGQSDSQGLKYVWTVYTSDGATKLATTTVTSAATQDAEFKIKNLTESSIAALAAGDKRELQIQFIPDATRQAGKRIGLLDVVELGGQTVHIAAFTAEAKAAQSVTVTDVTDAANQNDGFVQFSEPTPQGGVAAAAETGAFLKKVKVSNASGASKSVQLVLSAGFTFATAQPTSGNCSTTTTTTLTSPSGACEAWLVFQPGSAGSDASRFSSGVLSIMEGTSEVASMGLVGRMQVPVDLAITKTRSAASCGTDCVNLGIVAVGGTKQQPLTVTNIGDADMVSPIAVLSATIGTGTNATFTAQSDGCTGTRLLKGASCTINVLATGTALGAASATLTVAPAGTPATPPYATKTYAMAATVLNPAQIAVTPGSGVYPDAPVSGYSELADFVISNGVAGQNVPSGVVTVSLTGANADQFTLASTDLVNAGLAGGETRKVKVQFTPKKPSADGNAFTATLNVFDAGSATPGTPVKTVVLIGSPISALKISPAGTAGTVDMSSTGVLETFTVQKRNTATATAPLKTSLVGADFTVVNDWCYGKILFGDETATTSSCQITVKYTGLDTTSAKTATLTVDGDVAGAGKSVAVKVSYTGSAATGH